MDADLVDQVTESFRALEKAVQGLQPVYESLLIASERMWRYVYMRYLLEVWHFPYPLAVWWSNHIPMRLLPDMVKMWDKLILRELNEDRTG